MFRQLNQDTSNHCLQYLDFKSRWSACRVSKSWKAVLECLPYTNPLHLHELKGLTEENLPYLSKVCKSIRSLDTHLDKEEWRVYYDDNKPLADSYIFPMMSNLAKISVSACNIIGDNPDAPLYIFDTFEFGKMIQASRESIRE